jgi:hypothetical protein
MSVPGFEMLGEIVDHPGGDLPWRAPSPTPHAATTFWPRDPRARRHPWPLGLEDLDRIKVDVVDNAVWPAQLTRRTRFAPTSLVDNPSFPSG